MPFPLSISIIACDEEKNIARCLRSAAGLAEEIIVVDSGSKDRTREIAAEAGARVLHNDWPGHRDQKNVALGHCTQPWILALDCDEEISAELRRSIEQFFAGGACFAGATMNRRTWFMGRWIRHGDWYPDRKLRLFKRAGAKWGGSPEHDRVEMSGSITHLAGDLLHYSFRDTSHYLGKHTCYSDVFLERERAAGSGFSLFKVIARPCWRFLRAYFLRRGFLDGFPGLWIAVSTAYFTFVRYSRKYEDEVNAPS